MFAIRTKVLPCTDTKGTRIKASMKYCGVHVTTTVAYDHAHRAFANHKIACRALLLKASLPVCGLWSGGELNAGEYAWVRHDLIDADRA